MAADSSIPKSTTCSPPQNTMSTHSTELVTGTHQFNIAGYSLQKRIDVGQFIISGAFMVGGYNWTIRCYPAGERKESEGYVSLYLDLLSTSIEKATVRFSFQIGGPAGNSSPSRSSNWCGYSPNAKSWGFQKFIEIELVEQYLRSDCLTIRCTVEVEKESHTGATRSHFITVPPSGICQDLARLLESKQGSDVTFQIGQNDYDAHKVVVAMRSPVFSAQFFGSLADKAGGEGGRYVSIDDMEPAALEAVPHFIYMDTLPPVQDGDFLLSDSASSTELRKIAAGCSEESHREMVADWLAAADRYGLERMRLMCENKLCETINVENAAGTLELADRHHCPQLKAFCVEYIASPGVLRAVLETEGYKELKVNCPSLLAEIVERLGSGS